MTYRFYNPAPALMDLLGLKPCADGSLTFCEVGTTTEKDTWSDPGQSTPNANPVPLDSSGRTDTNIWLDGAYTITLRDGDGVVVWTRDVDSGQGSAATIPALVTGQFLTNDGSNLIWQDVRQVPDPSGSPEYILSTDGSNLIWIPQPEIPEPPAPDIVLTDTTAKFGVSDSATKFLIQSGTGTAPTSSSRTTNAAITFDTPYAKIWHVSVSSQRSSVGTYGIGATSSVEGYTPGAASNGFTAVFNSADDGGGSGYTITNSIPFTWVAFGLVTEDDTP